MTRSLIVPFVLLAAVECRGAEVCQTPGFKELSNLAADGATPSILAAQRWLAANGKDAEKLFVAVRSTEGGEELDVVDEIQCHAASARGCVGTFCATLVYDTSRNTIERATHWR